MTLHRIRCPKCNSLRTRAMYIHGPMLDSTKESKTSAFVWYEDAYTNDQTPPKTPIERPWPQRQTEFVRAHRVVCMGCGHGYYPSYAKPTGSATTPSTATAD